VHIAVNKCESEKTGTLSAADFWTLGLGEPIPVSALHGVGTAELMELTFESISTRKTAIEGFGTKVKDLKAARAVLKFKGPLPGEDDTEYKMRKYGVGDVGQKVLDKYEAARAAFDSEGRPEEIK
jgi:hypothetical protein